MLTMIPCSFSIASKKKGQTDPPTLWTNWCGPRGLEPDPQGQSGGPEGPAAKPWGLL